MSCPRRRPSALMEEKGEPYKVELIAEHAGKGEHISFYKQGEFTELCAGPHLMSIAAVKAFKLTNTAPALTGGATPRIKCSAACTVLHSPKRLCWRPTCKCWRRLRSGITASWARSWSCLPLWKKAPGSRSSCRRAWCSRNTLDRLLARDPHGKAGYHGDLYPDDPQPQRCGSAAVTGITIRKICTPPLLTMRTYAIKPMNCPGGILVYKQQNAFLQGSASAYGRAGPCAPA